ncbi:helix-turn-helix domain-containing protein [Streptomyces sp. NPDC003032]
MPQSPATSLPSPKERRRLREAKSLSQADVAAQLGVTRETVRSWEKGRTHPKGRSHEAYAKLLNAIAEEQDPDPDPDLAPAPAPAETPAPGLGPGPTPARHSARRNGSPQSTESARSTTRPEPPVKRAAKPQPPTAVAPTPAPATGHAHPQPAPLNPTHREPTPAPAALTPAGASGHAHPEPAPAQPAPAPAAESNHAHPQPAHPLRACPEPARPQPAHRKPAHPQPAPVPRTPAPAVRRRQLSSPAEAFDALCAHTGPFLVRQTYLLTGRRHLAQEAVERAFQQAWQRWPEVAVDRDPAGWVRAVAHEYALSPWHRLRPGLRPGLRRRDAPPAEPADRAFLDVLLRLSPARRRALLLYDGVGLDLPETAAETEASTPATANRLLHARETIAERLPDLADPEVLHRRLGELGGAEKLQPPKPERVRVISEHRARVWTRAAIAFTTLIVGATALTLRTAPTHYEPPQAPGRAINGVPPHMGPGPLSYEDEELRAKLRGEVPNGPHRLIPLPK